MPDSRRNRIIDRLEKEFGPDVLEVRDVSEKHHGHSGWREGGETHFEVDINAAVLKDLGRVDAHRKVNAALADEFADGLHALQIRILR